MQPNYTILKSMLTQICIIKYYFNISIVIHINSILFLII